MIVSGLILMALGAASAAAFTFNRRTELRGLTDEVDAKPRGRARGVLWTVDRKALTGARWVSLGMTYGGVAMIVAGAILVCIGFATT